MDIGRPFIVSRERGGGGGGEGGSLRMIGQLGPFNLVSVDGRRLYYSFRGQLWYFKMNCVVVNGSNNNNELVGGHGIY